jgi:hypothetical protein
MSPFASFPPLSEDEVLTGERLQSLADVAVITPAKAAFHSSRPLMPYAEFDEEFSPEDTPLTALKGAHTVFVYSEMIERFVQRILPLLAQPIVLLTHNGDADIGERHRRYADDPRISQWFAQNAVLEHPKVTPVPIGLANRQWPHGNTGALVDAVAAATGTKKLGLYVNFETGTNPSKREPILSALRDKPFSVLGRRATTRSRIAATVGRLLGHTARPADKALPYRDYLRELSQWMFCVSPPGNGLDCHRTWEALYLGAIPVLAEPLPRLLDGLPHLIVSNFENLTLQDLENRRAAMPAADGLERLRLSYWRDRITGISRK